jgi:hypothetical protein
MSKDELLTIRFKGERLKKEAIPIYELGQSFIALQQAVHKAWSISTSTSLSHIRRAEIRRAIALEVVQYKKSSDLFVLGAVFANPVVAPILTEAIKLTISGLFKYAQKAVLDGSDRQKTPNILIKDNSNSSITINNFAGSSYAQVTQLQTPIGGFGGVEEIELSSPLYTPKEVIVLDESTKKYTASIGQQELYGAVEHLEADPYKLYTRSSSLVAIHKGEKIFIRFSNPELFNFVRYQDKKNYTFKFTGRRVFKLNEESLAQGTFESDAVELA